MDERALRELELLPVVRLYSMATPHAAPTEEALRALVAECARPAGTWIFVADDEAGDPFAGTQGTLLESMLAAVGCRPGPPVPVAEVGGLEPRVIVVLGETAAARLLGTQATLAGLRGRAHDYRGIPVIVTYHPGHLLRSLQDKAGAWEDLVLARKSVLAA
jgi:uracil-DNA glycosylase